MILHYAKILGLITIYDSNIASGKGAHCVVLNTKAEAIALCSMIKQDTSGGVNAVWGERGNKFYVYEKQSTS